MKKKKSKFPPEKANKLAPFGKFAFGGNKQDVTGKQEKKKKFHNKGLMGFGK